MSKYVSRGLALVLFTGGLTLLGAGIANAADTTGDDGLLSGTQIVAPITAPVEVAGNAVSVLGDALSGGAAAPAPAAPAPAPAPAPVAAPTTSGTDSALGGTQAVVDATVPVAVQGNAISVAGDSVATPAPVAAAPAAEPAAPAAAPTTSGSDGILGGTQVLPTVSVPVNLGGNAISVLGDSSSSSEGASAPAATPAGSTGGATTTGSDSVAGGTQIVPNVTVPVTVGGNAISVLGDSSSSEGASAPAATPAGPTGGATTSGPDAIAGGTQVLPDIAVPVTVGGNAISVLGDSSSSEGAAAQAATPAGPTGGATTTGSDSVAGGTQVVPDVALPVSIGGNAISILGDAASTGSSTSPAQEGTNGGVTTTGNDGILGGTQIVPSITLPISIGDNAISILGDAEVTPLDDGTGGVDGLPGDPTDPVTPTDPTDPVIPTEPTDGTDGTDGTTVVVDAGVSTTATSAAFRGGATATAALSAQALASTGAEIAPLVGLIGLLLVAGIVLLIVGRRRAV